jgi:hypothetical protein
LYLSNGDGLGEKIRDLITIAVNKWMPFVLINDIAVSTTEDDNTIKENQIKVSIDFSVGQLAGKLDLPISV